MQSDKEIHFSGQRQKIARTVFKTIKYPTLLATKTMHLEIAWTPSTAQIPKMFFFLLISCLSHNDSQTQMFTHYFKNGYLLLLSMLPDR